MGPAPFVTGGTVSSRWENCSTSLEGFLYGGNVAGSCKNCVAGDESFGAWNSASYRMNLTITGTFEDCTAGDGAFGYTAGSGGDVLFNGNAVRCRVYRHGYAVAAGNYGDATCHGTLIDCDNKSIPGHGSYGFSASGNGTATGDFIRCTSEFASFGCSDYNMGTGTFAGVAEKCVGTDHCFGANTNTVTQAYFAGNAVDCYAEENSFGSRGSFNGTALRCRGGDGSFGNHGVANYSALLDTCEVRFITDTVGKGPPGMTGGTARNCWFSTAPGATVAALVLNGGLADTYTTRVLNCDLYVDRATAPGCISSSKGLGVYIMMAHCRTNMQFAPFIHNLIAVGLNVLDTNLDLDVPPT